MIPELLTFDIFGTVLDWRQGLRRSLLRHGVELGPLDFDRVIDIQAGLESGSFRSYAPIVASSLVLALGIPLATARAIGEEAGSWPAYPDSRGALSRLRRIAPCVASTNSDQSHGRQVQRELGFDLDGWICAEEVRCYKPDPAFWRHVAARRGVPFGRSWWHVSAYADYDLVTARRLGLTCVFVSRAHARWGPADLHVRDLSELAARLEAAVP
jgi:2-haloalkanoic acid dehalogenase type II